MRNMDLENLFLYFKREDAYSLGTLLLSRVKGWKLERILEFLSAVESDVNSFSKSTWRYEELRVRAGNAGLGSRGIGDFLIHKAVTSAASIPMDDAAGDSVVVAVDGFHSRLNQVPLLMAFHATRAAIRDIMVNGAEPLYTLIDVHLADDADLGKLVDIVAGALTASLATGARLVGGSTLRIGGDLVIGERVCGGSFAIGKRVKRWNRSPKPGLQLVATVGKGGGTATAFAITHNYHELVDLTINVDFAHSIRRVRELDCVHFAFDWTNGGILLDAFEMAEHVKVVLYDSVYEAVHPKLRKALEEEGIDPLGFSTDSIVFATSCADEVIKRVDGVLIGELREGKGVYLNNRMLRPKGREEPYTHVKKKVGFEVEEIDPEKLKKLIFRRAELLFTKLKAR